MSAIATAALDTCRAITRVGERCGEPAHAICDVPLRGDQTREVPICAMHHAVLHGTLDPIELARRWADA